MMMDSTSPLISGGLTRRTGALPVVVEPGVGPFTDGLELVLLPGVNVLRAENGFGKSLLLRLLGLFARQRLSMGDVAINDEATGLEVGVSFGAARMVARRGAKPKVFNKESLPPIEGLPEPISTL